MKSLICSVASATLLLLGSSALAQDEEQVLEDDNRAERIARIQELRQLQREEQEARRRDIQQRLEGLSEDERQALRERRRMMEQARLRRGERMRGPQRKGCPCPDPADQTEEQSEQP